jgi:hypothetical protein
MNEEDLRDCFAMFAMAGWIMNGDYSKTEIPTLAYQMADEMLEARKHKEKENEENIGIAAVVPKRSRKR